MVREIVKLIKFSPKKAHLFSEILAQPENSGITLKPLCPTLDCKAQCQCMEEINHTTGDEYGLKAGGILNSLEKFDMLFVLKLGYLVFRASESLSSCLQAKYTSLQEALAAVYWCKSFYRRQKLMTLSINFMMKWLNVGLTCQSTKCSSLSKSTSAGRWKFTIPDFNSQRLLQAPVFSGSCPTIARISGQV